MTYTLIFVNDIKLFYQQEIWEYKCFMGLPSQHDHYYMPACKVRDNKKRFHLGRGIYSYQYPNILPNINV